MAEASHHVVFRQQLIAASAATNLIDAACQWEFSHFGSFPKGELNSCQICNTRIVNFIAIRNVVNEAILLIGHDCHDKLLYFISTHKLQAAKLRTRTEYKKLIRDYMRVSMGKKNKDRQSFLAWLRIRDVEQNLPDDISSILDFVLLHKIPPSIEAAERLVAYYNNTRLFPAEVIIGSYNFVVIFCRRRGIDVPDILTINQGREISKRVSEEMEKDLKKK